MKKQVLLVQPAFPIPRKSQFHKDYLPVGLLKLAAWHKSQGDEVRLVVGDQLLEGFIPEKVYVTSLFTYWASEVAAAISFYRKQYPAAEITVGGIYASLAPDHCKMFTGCDLVQVGVHPEAELFLPDYSLVNTDFQILHASRGCIRRCAFCGTHVIEPVFAPKASIKNELVKNHVVFYDNNLLGNPSIADILDELAEARVNNRVVHCESQSGLDGRLLEKDPHLAGKLHAARFKTARIAWDGPLSDSARISDQLSILRAAGYSTRDLQVFILYNHDLQPEEIAEKVETCFRLGVQVTDCRMRPLDRFSDGYNPQQRVQPEGEYFLSPGWKDADVRGVRKAVRTNNICLRYGIPRDNYHPILERVPRSVRQAAADRLGLPQFAESEGQLEMINAELLFRAAARQCPEPRSSDECSTLASDQ